MPESDESLAHKVQHITLLVELKISQFEGDLIAMKDTLHAKLDSLKESIEHLDEMNETKSEVIRSSVKRLEEELRESLSTTEKHNRRITDLEGFDTQKKARSFDGLVKWAIGLIATAVTALVMSNWQKIIDLLGGSK